MEPRRDASEEGWRRIGPARASSHRRGHRLHLTVDHRVRGVHPLPDFSSLYYSFTEYNLFSSPDWVGLENYRSLLFEDRLFRTALWNTVYIAILGVAFGLLTSIPLALLLNTEVHGLTIFRSIFFLPTIVPIIASAILWKWLLNANYGLLNAALSLLHLPAPAWLADPTWIKPALVLMSLWGVGAPVILYLAALQDVPRSLYEVADLDGATYWQKTWNITLPMISPVILFNTIIAIIGWLQYFSDPSLSMQAPVGRPTPPSSMCFTSTKRHSGTWKWAMHPRWRGCSSSSRS